MPRKQPRSGNSFFIKIPEKDIENAVCEWASLNGFISIKMECRNHDGKMFNGHAGLPDRMFICHNKVIFVEFKTRTGKIRNEQKDWANKIKYHLGEKSHAICRSVDEGIRFLNYHKNCG